MSSLNSGAGLPFSAPREGGGLAVSFSEASWSSGFRLKGSGSKGLGSFGFAGTKVAWGLGDIFRIFLEYLLCKNIFWVLPRSVSVGQYLQYMI